MCLNCGNREVTGQFSNEDGSGFCSAVCADFDEDSLPIEIEAPPTGSEMDQMYGDYLSDIESGRYDDDPSPYDGTYSEE